MILAFADVPDFIIEALLMGLGVPISAIIGSYLGLWTGYLQMQLRSRFAHVHTGRDLVFDVDHVRREHFREVFGHGCARPLSQAPAASVS